MKKSSSNRPSFDELHSTKRPSFGYVYGYYYRALQDYYDGQLSFIEICLLEYMIAMSDYYLSYGHATFYHSYSRIHEDTRIAIGTVKSFVEKFKKLGILSTELTNQYGRKVTTFQVEYLKIIRRRKLIFGEPKSKTDEQVRRIKTRLAALIKMHVERSHILKWEQSSY